VGEFTYAYIILFENRWYNKECIQIWCDFVYCSHLNVGRERPCVVVTGKQIYCLHKCRGILLLLIDCDLQRTCSIRWVLLQVEVRNGTNATVRCIIAKCIRYLKAFYFSKLRVTAWSCKTNFINSILLKDQNFFYWRNLERHFTWLLWKVKCKSSPVTGLEWPTGFQEVKVPRFHDNGTGWW